MATLEELQTQVATLTESLAAVQGELKTLTDTTPTSYSMSRYSTEETDRAVDRAKEGGAIDTVLAGKAGLVQLRRPNLLDNSYWAAKKYVINQRGLDLYAAAAYIYTIDRWVANQLTVELADDGLVLTPSGVDDPKLYQCIEHVPLGVEVTFSALLGNDLISVSGWSFSLAKRTVGNCQLEIGTANGYQYGLIRLLNGQKLTGLKAAKLELGSMQTLARQEGGVWVLNDPPPNKALELLKCQRYQIQIYNTAWAAIGNGYATSATELSILVPLPCIMRTMPVVEEFSGTFTIRGMDSYYEVPLTSVTVSQYANNGVRIKCTYANAAFTVGAFYSLEMNNGNSVIFSCNL